MPYIEQERRDKINLPLNNISTDINTIGTLNYTITKLCLNFLQRSRVSYTTLNEIVGVLECAKLEFYRKAVSKYENVKCLENGEVYLNYDI